VPKAFYWLNKIQGRDKSCFSFQHSSPKACGGANHVFSQNYDTVAAVAFEVAGT